MMQHFEVLLDESASLHGHLCAGQVLGVRMAMLGCNLVGIEDPQSSRDLLTYVEIDRCATDAIQAVTGCKLGRRTLKYLDYGKVAATFVNMGTGTAWRVVARDDARDHARDRAPEGLDKKEAQVQAYKAMSDEELFNFRRVIVEIPEVDLPGHPLQRVVCDSCGEGVNDGRHVDREGLVLCRPCASGAYYSVFETP